MGWTREQMAARAARELCDRCDVNLYIGVQKLVAIYIPNRIKVPLQSENGMSGLSPFLIKDDPDLKNGKHPLTTVPTSSFFSSAGSFALMRGGSIDIVVFGAMEVAAAVDLANWIIPGKIVKGLGGAMDLVAGVKRVFVITHHVTKSGAPKLLEGCTLSLTGRACVELIVTVLAVLACDKPGFGLMELAPGFSIDEVHAKTGATVTPEEALAA